MLLVILPTVCMAAYEVKTIAKIKTYSSREEAEKEKEKLMREAVEKEVQRLMQENEGKEADGVESGKDNES